MTSCKLTFICAREWIELRKGDNSDVRHCETCKTDVFAVYDEAEFAQHRAQGHCVAMFLSEAAPTMGLPAWDFGDGASFDPILYRPLSELEELSPHILKSLSPHGIGRIGDVVGLTHAEVLQLLQGSEIDLALLRDVLASRGLNLGMQLDGWTR